MLKIPQKRHHGRIKRIYIDPPSNTGKDVVYPDDFREGLETYLEWIPTPGAAATAVEMLWNR